MTTIKSNVSFWEKWGGYLIPAIIIGFSLFIFPGPLLYPHLSSNDSDEAESIRRHGTYGPSVA